MRHLLSSTFLLLAAGGAAANTFTLSPQQVSTPRATASRQIAIQFTPGSATSRAEVDLAIKLDDLGFYSLLPATSSGPHAVRCELREGVVVATVYHPAGLALPQQTVTVCRLSIRPHDDTPTIAYGLRLENAAAANRFGFPLTVQAPDGALYVDP